MSSPFDLANQPSVIHARPNYLSFLRAFRREYGVSEPHLFYQSFRRQLLDRALPDPYGLSRHATLDDWWEANVLAWKHADMIAAMSH
ncbi:MAG: hypothetical protein ACOZB0_06355 [Pseudomonadota bacterium]